MVEAAVVIPVMLVFLGLIMFTNKSYESKIDRQEATRAGLLYFAAHSCTKQPPQSITKGMAIGNGTTTEEADPGTPDGVPKSNADQQSAKLGPSAQGGISKSHQLAHASPQDLTITGNAIDDRKTVPLKRTIHAEAEVACNEKAFTSSWKAMLGFVPKFLSDGGGFMN